MRCYPAKTSMSADAATSDAFEDIEADIIEALAGDGICATSDHVLIDGPLTRRPRRLIKGRPTR